MVPKVSLIIAALAALALLFPTAAAQDDGSRIADTDLKLGTNPFLGVGSTMARGEPVPGFVDYSFCHGAGGFNPQAAALELTLELTGAPAWLTVTISDEPTQTIPLPVGPTVNQEEACPPDGVGDWALFAEASNQAPYGEKATITATVTVEETGTSHTYKVPAGEVVTMSIEMQADPGEDIDAKLQNATRDPGTPTTNNNNGGGTEESPPAPVAAMVVGFVLLVAFARRR